MFGVPVVGGFVQKFGTLAGHHKAVGKARWHPYVAVIVGAQLHANPLAKVWRTAAQVHRYVKHLAMRYPHQFALRLLDLVMQATQHTLR